jgi:hypothetical protein
VWTTSQRERLGLEHAILQQQGFAQFGVYFYKDTDSYNAYGYATSNSGRRYFLWMPIPSGFPEQRPPLYITDPRPLLDASGRSIVSLGISHYMHTLAPQGDWVQICHWRDDRWHSGIVLQKVFLKAHLWIEAYEQHLATGKHISEFVLTMAGRS